MGSQPATFCPCVLIHCTHIPALGPLCFSGNEMEGCWKRNIHRSRRTEPARLWAGHHRPGLNQSLPYVLFPWSAELAFGFFLGMSGCRPVEAIRSIKGQTKPFPSSTAVPKSQVSTHAHSAAFTYVSIGGQTQARWRSP